MKKVFERLIDAIPDYQEFLTVDELDESSRKLARMYPDIVELFEIGRTSKDHPILCLKIGNGSNNGLMCGCPHPNEPIGAMMLEHFSWHLVKNKDLRDELDYTWYLVKTWDADGTKLNEDWFKGPYSIRNYARNFYRPANFKQVEWNFPIDYKELHFHESTPETKAIMNLLDKIQPKFIYSLHNAVFGGAFWYIGEGVSGIYEDLKQSAEKHGIPLHLGEPEAECMVELVPAIYKLVSIKDIYDYFEQHGATNIPKTLQLGENSGAYAKERWGTFSAVPELPYFYDERIMDMSESDMVRKDVVLARLDYEEEANQVIKGIMDISLRYISENNLFLLALKSLTQSVIAETARKMISENPEYKKFATVAEKFDNLFIRRFHQLLKFGTLIRMNEEELVSLAKSGEQNEDKENALRKAMAEAEAEFDMRADFLEKNSNYQVIPIKTLVEIQLEGGVRMVDYLNMNACIVE